jgi:hypothetical protein
MSNGDNAPRMPVCPGCGVVAPVRAETCASCKRELSRPRTFAPVTDVTWVALRASITCRSCGFPSPLEGIVMGDGVDCAQCGSYQRFDNGAWRGGLAFAHAVGDLAGPHPEGRFPSADVWIGDLNPHANVGVTVTFATEEKDGVRVEACPGFPVCRRCRALLEVRVERGVTTTRCAGCGAQARYALPTSLSSESARAVVAEEQRLERREVKVQATATGLVALTCPQCGAAVKPLDGTTVECTYCRAIAFVPPRARPRGPERIVEPIVFFVAFEGPSPPRAELERPKPPDEKKTTKDKAKNAISRGISPLPGIDLADPKPGLDVRQLALTLGLSAVAITAGYFLYGAIH